MEIWKDIKGYEGLYKVSNYGNIKSLPREKYRKTEMILSQKIKKHGYKDINLSKDGIIKTHPVHRLVALAFIQNVNNKPCVNHIDCNPSNNNILNLEWVTYLENQMHSRKLGRYDDCNKKSSKRFLKMHENKDKRFKQYSE